MYPRKVQYRLKLQNRSTDTAQSEHKKAHKTDGNLLRKVFPPKVVSEPDPASGHYNPFPTFPYTGKLRPVYPLSPRRTVPDSIQHPDYAPDGMPRSETRMRGRNNIAILDQKGQDAMRKVCRLAREVLDIVAAAIKPGVTTDYLDEICHNECIKRKAGLLHISSLPTFPSPSIASLTPTSPTPLPSTTSASPNPSAPLSTR